MAERGALVRVLAGPQPAASAAAAGMLGPISEAAGETGEGHPRLLELGLRGLALWRARGPAFGVRESGALLTWAPKKRARAAELARAHGLALEERAEGLFLPEEALLDPAAASQAVCAAIGELDGKILESEAAPWLAGARLAGVRLGTGEQLTADCVLLAPGGWASPAWAELAPALRRLTPARGCLVAFAQAQPEAHVERAEGLYFAPQPGALLAGASMELGVADPRPDPDQLARLHARAIALRPELARLAWTGRAGVRALSPDRAPLLGAAGPPGLLLGAGFGRNGWLLALAAGEILARLALGEMLTELEASFAPERFGELG